MNMHVFGKWKETAVDIRKQKKHTKAQMHRENMQTAQKSPQAQNANHYVTSKPKLVLFQVCVHATILFLFLTYSQNGFYF